MTATLRQGSREEKLTANRTLERFLSPERQKLLGFDEFPTDLVEVMINGKQAQAWDHDVVDGDTVTIKLPSESIGVSAVATATAPSTNNIMQDMQALRTENDRLKAAIRAYTEGTSGSSNGLNSILESIESMKIQLDNEYNLLCNIEGKIRDARDEIQAIKDRFDDLASHLNDHMTVNSALLENNITANQN